MQKIFKPLRKTKNKLLLYSSSVSAGFPSPAEDYIEHKLDLNDYVISHPEATFFVRVKGESMLDAGISEGDLLVVDRSLNPTNNSVVIAVIDNDFLVKRIIIHKKAVFLHPENPNFKPINISLIDDFKIWGVVTFIIKKAK